MQIDMHFGATYVMARLAGFPTAEAHIIANAAQYVDDAKVSGFVRFDNGALFQRITTVHSPASGKNLDSCENHLAWLPFHFLPGNTLLSEKEMTAGDYASRLLCSEDSVVMEDVVADCIAARDQPQALYRLGITAHTFLDTFAHQRFGGFIHKYNWVGNIKGEDPAIHKSCLAGCVNLFVDFIRHPEPMLGHGLALTYPDLPWLKWSYRDGFGKTVSRVNAEIFIRGLCGLYRVFRRYRGEAGATLSPDMTEKLKSLIVTIQDSDGVVRLKKWQAQIQANAFCFGAEQANYVAEHWRSEALHDSALFDETDHFQNVREICYPPDFMSSPWKLFHDAAKAHRYAVIQKILPKYGLCAA